MVKRTDTVMVVATSISDNIGGKPQTVRWNLRLDVSDVDGKLLISRLEQVQVRNRLRVLAFDIAAPLAAIAALIYIGMAMGWPLWWVSLASVLCLLIVEGVIVNVVLARRDGVTVGTDDDGPGAAAGGRRACHRRVGRRGGGRLHAVDGAGPRPARRQRRGGRASPAAWPRRARRSHRRARRRRSTGRQALMTPDRAEKYKNEFTAVAKQLTSKNVSAQASTISAGVEAIGPQDASVAVIMRGTQSVPGKPPDVAVLALRVTLSKDGDRWLVDDVVADQLALSRRAYSTFRQRSITT